MKVLKFRLKKFLMKIYPLCNYLHALMMKMISHWKHIWQVWSESDVAIWLLLPGLGVFQVI